MLISYTVTGQLICAFVFAFAKSRFSHDVAHIERDRIKKAYLSLCCSHLAYDKFSYVMDQVST